MIYCVVPEPLADELYEKLVKYYDDDPNVEVIVDRRKSSRREQGSELSELEAADQLANASADERGALRLAVGTA